MDSEAVPIREKDMSNTGSYVNGKSLVGNSYNISSKLEICGTKEEINCTYQVMVLGKKCNPKFKREEVPSSSSDNPHALASYEGPSEQCIVPQRHCSVHHEYAATQDNASAAGRSPQRDTSSVNQYDTR